MSDEELSILHTKSCALFEELYEAKGEPAELDDAFLKEYFEVTAATLGLDEVELMGPHKTEARLSKPDKGLVDVRVIFKNEKFLVSNLASVKTLGGTSQRFGKDRGKGTYLMTSIKGIPNITIKSGKAVVKFVGYPATVEYEEGRGEWVKM